MTQQSVNKDPLRVEFQVHFRAGRRGRKHLGRGSIEKNPRPTDGDIPRLVRLLALAYRWNRLIEDAVVANHAEIARIMGLSRARVTQITDLLYLAPDIQEELLFPARGQESKPSPRERAIRLITGVPSWAEQRGLWRVPSDPLPGVKAESHERDT